jgi:serine/threonine protein kinase
MELVRGPSLKQLLQEHGRGFPIDVAINVLRGVLRAMVAAHGAGVLHRDLKPGNVLLQLDRRKLTALTPDDVKVVDFGLGHVASETLGAIAQSASLERGDRLVGTLAYLAPELRDGAAKADGRSDLYSIGVILFEMLTGERPAGAELPRSLRPDAPAALDEVFSRLYARADRRYDSAQAALDDLEARLQTTAVPPLPRRAAPPPPPGTIPGVPCPGCGRLVEADDQFCTHCGRQLVSWIRRCPSCMAYPGRHDQYCIFCGANLPALQA